ncbi:MAG: hypothetical protein K6C06_10660 [Lachnospiraceae bacterium]|nr:hypothetical protein [Lachnospiraceae bacterium]
MRKTELTKEQMEQKKEKQELNQEEVEKISAGSWLGNIWNKIKSFGD